MEHKQVFTGFSEVRHTLHGSGPGTNNSDPFVRQVGHKCALGITTGVGVIPATGMKGMALKRFYARYTWQLGNMQRACAHGHKLGSKRIAPVGTDQPA